MNLYKETPLPLLNLSEHWIFLSVMGNVCHIHVLQLIWRHRFKVMCRELGSYFWVPGPIPITSLRATFIKCLENDPQPSQGLSQETTTPHPLIQCSIRYHSGLCLMRPAPWCHQDIIKTHFPTYSTFIWNHPYSPFTEMTHSLSASSVTYSLSVSVWLSISESACIMNVCYILGISSIFGVEMLWRLLSI